MSNLENGAARRFHDGTSHPGGDLFRAVSPCDPATRPLPYKVYTTLDPIALPTSFTPSSAPALDAVGSSGPAQGTLVPDFDALGRVLFFSNGVTKHIRRGGRLWPFRAAPCTGALYHVELYAVCGDLPGLAAGVYHYGAHDNALRQLRSGDFRRVLIQATGNEPSVSRAPAVLIATSTFWRNSWKYQARAYRHTFWDTGTMLANTLATAAASGLPAAIVLGFVDDAVNRLLDVDGEQEFAVVLVPLGRDNAVPPATPPVEPLGLPFEEAPRPELDEPAIRAVHAASSLASAEEVLAWRSTTPDCDPSPPSGATVPLPLHDPLVLPQEPIEMVIRRRGSTRQFALDPITWPQLSMILRTADTDVATDLGGTNLTSDGDIYLLVNAVEGLAAGTYVYHAGHQELEQLTTGDVRAQAHHLALDQDLGGDAAVNFYLMNDLATTLAEYGDRGYRAAQLLPAIFAGKVYLASYALGLGATGLTFWDDDVTAFLSPHAFGKSPMFLVAVGHPFSRR